jgi:hypothetical protein
MKQRFGEFENCDKFSTTMVSARILGPLIYLRCYGQVGMYQCMYVVPSYQVILWISWGLDLHFWVPILQQFTTTQE